MSIRAGRGTRNPNVCIATTACEWSNVQTQYVGGDVIPCGKPAATHHLLDWISLRDAGLFHTTGHDLAANEKPPRGTVGGAQAVGQCSQRGGTSQPHMPVSTELERLPSRMADRRPRGGTLVLRRIGGTRGTHIQGWSSAARYVHQSVGGAIANVAEQATIWPHHTAIVD